MPDDPIDSINEEAGLSPNWVPVDVAPIIPGQIPSGSPPTYHGRDPYNSGPISPNFGLQTDLAKTDLAPGYGSVRLMPVEGGPGPNAKAIGVSTTIATTIVKQAIAAIPPAAPAVGDGLIHGYTTWEDDPAFVNIREEFIGGENLTTSNAGTLGETGFRTVGSFLAPTSDTGGAWGGIPPHIGVIAWANSTGSASAGSLCYSPHSGGNIYLAGWPLLENPSWELTWVFQLHTNNIGSNSTATAFPLTKKSFYCGLQFDHAGVNGTAENIRPPIFIGVRFDNDMTAPSINDTTFKLENVNNPVINSARNNTQGTVVDTGFTPTNNQWCRLTLQCTVVGQVKATFVNGNASVTTTFTVPKVTVISTGTGAESAQNGLAQFGNPSGIDFPWVVGSQVIVSNATDSVLNGTYIADSASSIVLDVPSGASIANHSASYTIVGYPGLVPFITFGNDSEATPTSNAFIAIDTFTFLWNPGVGGGTATPNSNLSRFFGT